MPTAYPKALPSNDSKYCLEAGRLDSFDDGWSHESLCSKENMAKAGFYYTGSGDMVKCFTCFKKLETWDPDVDEPWLKHKEMSPTCMFAQIGKEEGLLTVEQWCDVMCARAINTYDQKFISIQKILSSSSPS